MAGVNYTDILPLEVLEHIISFLDPETQKVAKLVSRKWCNASRGLKKIVISDVYADWVDKILKMCTQSRNHFEDIEFYCVNFVDFQCSTFWESCGHRIKSLRFYDARISPEIFMNIVVKSPRLTHVSMNWSLGNRHLASFDQIVCLLDDLIQRNQKNNSLVSLEIGVPRSSSTQLLVRIFSVFPNLKMLKIFYWDRMSKEDESLVISQTITWKEQMEVLSLKSFVNPGFKWTNILLRTDLTRLKEIHFDITPETSIELLTGFLGRQLNLQHLDIEVCGYTIFDGSEVLQDFVYSHESCRNLKIFKLSCSVNLVWRSDWFVLLAKSSLHTLALECCQFEYTGSENSCISKTLKILQFCERSPERIQVYNFHVISFIQTFTALEKLELAGVTAEIMYAVNKYQSGLRVFRTMNEWFGVVGQSKMKSDILSLPNLVDMEELSIFCGDPDFSCNFLKYFRPHLRYLYIDKCVDFKSFLKILPNAPFLKSLIIKVNVCIFLENRKLFTRIATSMTKLKHLWICMSNEGDRPQPCTELAEEIFKECPSLRLFIFTAHVYFYNIIEKKVHLKKDAFVSGPHLLNDTLDFKNNYLEEITSYVIKNSV